MIADRAEGGILVSWSNPLSCDAPGLQSLTLVGTEGLFTSTIDAFQVPR
jgi:hypothetical protein